MSELAPPQEFHGGRVVLRPGDCLDVLRSLSDNSIDTVVTDPPYALVSISRRYGKEGAKPAKVGATGAYARASAGFMGKHWDTGERAFAVDFWEEVYRVLKPGGHVLAFSATRTVHRLTCAIEDAGFEIRDAIWQVLASDTFVLQFMESLDDAQRAAFARCIEESQFGGALAWIYGSGFPKSHDVAKAIDAADTLAPRRERALRFTGWIRSTGLTAAEINRLTSSSMGSHYTTAGTQPEVATAEMFDLLRPALPEVPEEIEELVRARTVESENLKRREVVGQHEAPAHAASWREAYEGSKAAGAGVITKAFSQAAQAWEGWGTAMKPALEPITVARKPLIGTVAENVLAHGTGALNIDACRVEAPDGVPVFENGGRESVNAYGDGIGGGVYTGEVSFKGRWPANVVTDGSAEVEAAFPSSESPQPRVTKRSADGDGRNGYGAFKGQDAVVIGHGDSGSAARFFYSAKADADGRVGSKHPTVKPVDLMRWCVRLVTPPGGVVLDPFAGTGTTGEAALLEGFRAILIEREAEYQADIARRMTLAFAGPAIRKAERVKARPDRKAKTEAPLFGEGML